MNNLFDSKGKLDGSTFVINYIILIIAYIILGGGLFLLASKFPKLLMLTFVVIFLIKVLITFNYKKRFMDILPNLPAAIFLSIILGFDTEIVLPYIHKYGAGESSALIFYSIMALLFLIPPAILAFIPSRKKDN